MAQYDSVIEAVRYTPDGKVDIVRGYLRRNAVWSDRVLISRQALIDLIRSGKQVLIGQRVPYLGGTFTVQNPIKMRGEKGSEVLFTAQNTDSRDVLEGLPLF